MTVLFPPDMPEHQRAALQAIYETAAQRRQSFELQDYAKRRIASRKGWQTRRAKA